MSASVFSVRADPWAPLEKSIFSEVKQAGDVFAVTNCEEIKASIRNRDKAKLIEMCYQSQRPYVAFAGLAGLTAIDTNAALSTSIRLAWCSDLKNFAWLAPVSIPLFSNKTDVLLLNHTLSPLMKIKPLDRNAAGRMVDCFYLAQPAAFMQWFNSQDHAEDLPSNLCFVFESICIDFKSRGAEIPANIRELLKEYKHIPGIPRLTYFELYPVEDEAFRIEFLSEIQSDSISDEEFGDLIRFRDSLARELLRKGFKQMSAHRLDLLKTILGEK